MPQQPCHEAGAHVLKGQRGPVEELQGVDSGLHFAQRAVKAEGLADNAGKFFRGDIFPEKSLGHFQGIFHEAPISQRPEKGLRQLRNALGHIEAAVFREPLDHRLP